jgi:hypothetical protein
LFVFASRSPPGARRRVPLRLAISSEASRALGISRKKALVVNVLGHGFELENIDIAAPLGREVL